MELLYPLNCAEVFSNLQDKSKGAVMKRALNLCITTSTGVELDA